MASATVLGMPEYSTPTLLKIKNKTAPYTGAVYLFFKLLSCLLRLECCYK
jgi:hypothetical protein